MFNDTYFEEHLQTTAFVFQEWLHKKLLSTTSMKREINISNQKRFQKQSSIGVLIKRYSESMQQIYRRTSMSKCNFSKVEKQLC